MGTLKPSQVLIVTSGEDVGSHREEMGLEDRGEISSLLLGSLTSEISLVLESRESLPIHSACQPRGITEVC